MSAAFGLSCCSFTLVLESMLSHCVKSHHDLVPKRCHHRGKNIVPLRSTEKPVILFTPLRRKQKCFSAQSARFLPGNGIT